MKAEENNNQLQNDMLKKMLDYGKQKHSLTYAEVLELFGDHELSVEQIEEIYEQLAQAGIEIVPCDDLDEVPTPDPNDEDLTTEAEPVEIDLTVP